MTERTIVIGAGAGGLAAAISLAARDVPVTVVEASSRVGGKMRSHHVAGHDIPAGPTVLTMKWAFDQLLEPAGMRLEDIVDIKRADVLARHAWPDGSRFDLLAHDEAATEAVRSFAGSRDAEGFRAFMAESRRIHGILLDTHMKAQRPSFAGLMSRIGPRRFGDMMALRPYSSLWKALSEHFADPRLRQLFGRYSTYTGSSPFSIPATLMLVAHVEREGVWHVRGGMAALASALRKVAERLGVDVRLDSPVERLEKTGRKVSGVRLRGGELLRADHVVANVDASALDGLVEGSGVRPVPPRKRSYSAITWCAAARTSFDLAYHTVFFSGDYAHEFEELGEGKVPSEPTTYICAPARDDVGNRMDDGGGAEGMLMLVNAPPQGDREDYGEEADRCMSRVKNLLSRCGMTLDDMETKAVTPTDFAADYPATGGALYGRTNDGPFAGFRRPGARTAIGNLFLAGGSCHPGPGVPMSAISGMLAAERVMEARASTRRSRPVAISGGTPMASAKTGSMPSR